MSGHLMTIVPVVNDQWAATCSCRKRSKPGDYLSGQKWIMEHERELERIRIHQSRTPTLKDQRDYFRERSQDAALPEDQRQLWEQLASELDRCVGDRHHEHEQTLF